MCFLYLILFVVCFFLKNVILLLFLCWLFIRILINVDLFELFFLINLIVLLVEIVKDVFCNLKFEFLYCLFIWFMFNNVVIFMFFFV